MICSIEFCDTYYRDSIIPKYKRWLEESDDPYVNVDEVDSHVWSQIKKIYKRFSLEIQMARLSEWDRVLGEVTI